MRGRFAILVRMPAHRTTARLDDIAARLRGLPGFETAFDSEKATVVVTAIDALPLPQQGIVLGSVFRPGTTGPLRALGDEMSASVASSRGQYLIDRCWGHYVAVLAGARSIDVVRSPFGSLPCYFMSIEGGTLLASDAALLGTLAGVRLEVDWDAVAMHLLAGELAGARTCLRSVTELRGGERLSVADGQITIDPLWSPWTHAARDRAILDPAEARRRVGGAVQSSIAGLGSRFDRIVLMLSGGLDSSIVAACLAMQNRAFVCTNLVSHDAAGDERRYARLVTEALDVTLVEGLRDVSRIRIEQSAAARHPRPSRRSFAQESRRIALDTAAEFGAGAIFSGGGGDNVFCSLQSASPAADRLLTTGIDRHFWRTSSDIARLAPASLWTVATRAMRRAWFTAPDYRWHANRQLLSARACAHADDAIQHPWLVAPADALPGKAAHVALLAVARGHIEGIETEDSVETVLPLLAQPVVEACLQVPSWSWFEDGHNRAVARHAFDAHLPTAVAWRRSKGSPDSFIAEIYERYRPAIRELLVDGELAAHDIIDIPATNRILDDPAPLRGGTFRRILQLADVEAWARSWTAQRADPARAGPSELAA